MSSTIARNPEATPHWALFLDRDGVINVDHGYVGARSRFEWMPGARAAIALATRLGWRVFVVTNQSGVARGYYTEDDVRDLHDWMVADLLDAGGVIDDIRYCPHHPDASVAAYRGVCACRKPAPGMILELLRAWRVDSDRAVLVGDRDSDMQAAMAAGIDAVKFTGGNLEEFLRPILSRAMPRGTK